MPKNVESDTIEAKVQDATGRSAAVMSDVKERFGPMVADARERVGPIVADAKERMGPLVADAKERGGAYVEQAKEWAAPRLDEARQKAAPVVASAVATVVPQIENALEEATSRLVTALESTGEARDEVARRGTAAVSAFKGELTVPEPKSHWGRRLLVLGLLAGVGAAVFAFFRRRDEDDSWITAPSTYPESDAAAASFGSATSPSTDSEPSASTEGADDNADDSSDAQTKRPAAKSSKSTTTKAAAAKHTAPTHDIEGNKAGEDGGTADTSADQAGAGLDEAVADATEEPKPPTTPEHPTERTTPKDS